MHMVTSTNGIPLAKIERARKVVSSGLDFIVFTIGGIHQESYSRYHVRGRIRPSLAGPEERAACKGRGRGHEAVCELALPAISME